MLTENQRKIIKCVEDAKQVPHYYLKKKTGLTDRGLSRSLKLLLREGSIIRKKEKGKHPVYKLGVFNHILADWFKCSGTVVPYLKKRMSTNDMLTILNIVGKQDFISDRYKKFSLKKEIKKLDSKSLQNLIEILDLSGLSATGFVVNRINVTMTTTRRKSLFPEVIQKESDKHIETLYMMRDGISRSKARKILIESKKKAEKEAKQIIAAEFKDIQRNKKKVVK